MASSSLLCQFLLISLIAIGTLLLVIVPDVQALECYSYETKNASLAMGGRAARELNKVFTIPTGNGEHPLIVSMGAGKPSHQCPAGSNFCATLHCTSMFGDKTIKACFGVAWSKDPTYICQQLQKLCPGDPKFYCRFCNTDKCNDD